MSDLNPPPVDSPVWNEQHHRDACSYSVEVAKQFITLASAGVAFVVGLAVAGGGRYAYWYVTALVLLGFSLFVGIGYIMNVVGHINLDNNYNVYSARLKWVAVAQILLFLLALLVLCKLVWFRVRLATPAVATATTIEISTNAKTTKYSIPTGGSVVVTIKPSGDVQAAFVPSK